MFVELPAFDVRSFSKKLILKSTILIDKVCDIFTFKPL